MSDTHVLLVRHPETDANVSGRFVGRGDTPFTETGLLQLRRLPAKIAAFRPELIWSSPLERAHALARRSSHLCQVPVSVDARLLELDFGDAEGLTYDEIVARGMSFDYRSLEEPVAPNGESRGQIERRAAALCDELTARGGRHAIVTHGGVYRASLVHLLGLSATDVWAFRIENAQLAHVHVVDGHGMLKSFVQG